GDGLEALDAIGRHTPDLVFLDIQMPGLTGFEVARKLVDREPPVTVIFVTAFDEHAIDYLLKPIDGARVETAVQRARRRVGPEGPLNDRLERIVQLVEGRKGRPEQVAVKAGERFLLVQAEDIIFASMADDSITIVTGHVSGTCNFRTLDELQ